MSASRLKILLPTDVFPPRCGGAGWSAHALALALRERGHDVTALVPHRGAPGIRRDEVLGVPTIHSGYWAPDLPFIQNYFRHERLWPRLADLLCDLAQANTSQRARVPLLIHAQHAQTGPAAIMAGRRLGAPVVITVRDHWPWDYFATGLHGDRLPYGKQTWASLATDLVARRGPARGAVALPALPYMLAHLQRRQRALRQADAVVAVSEYIAQRLAGIVAPERVHVIPNLLDLAAIDATIATPPTSVVPGEPYLLFVGKLERNKGAHLLVDVFRDLNRLRDWSLERGDWRSDVSQALISMHQSLELVVAGDGPLRSELERELAVLGVRAHFLTWLDHDEVVRLMAHCTLLLFPSAWGEPLSRVLLEAMACSAAILAMPTGGTPDMITDGVNGALEPTAEGFARRLAVLLQQPEQRRALGAAARHTACERFAKQVVVERMEELYRSLV